MDATPEQGRLLVYFGLARIIDDLDRVRGGRVLVRGPCVMAEGRLAPRAILGGDGEPRWAGVSRCSGRRREGEDRLADGLILRPLGPGNREHQADAAGRDGVACGHVDKPRSPDAGVTLAQRIGRLSLVVIPSLLVRRGGLQRQVGHDRELAALAATTPASAGGRADCGPA